VYMDSHSVDSFVEELTKIAKMDPEQKKRMKRYLADAAVGAVGFGTGYGLGSAAGRLLADKNPSLVKHKYAPVVIGGLSAGGAILAKRLAEKRKKYREQPVDSR